MSATYHQMVTVLHFWLTSIPLQALTSEPGSSQWSELRLFCDDGDSDTIMSQIMVCSTHASSLSLKQI